MPETPDLRWIKAPLQARSERTLEALLDATERLLEEGPIQSAGVSNIAREAGSSVGAFYHRFPDKQSLTRTLYERFREQSLATIEENFAAPRWEGHTLDEIVQALVTFTVHDYLARPGLRRFVMHLIESDPQMRASARDLSARVVRALGGLLASRRDEMGHPDPYRAAEFMHRMLFSTLDQVALFHGESPTGTDLSEDELADQLGRAIRGYLRTSGASEG